jgi:glycosyltransferase involved in cell wall biosynthesis
MSPDVSVVIPVYNGEDTLAACLGALASQSVAKSRVEVIVVDDGSTDGTAAVAERFGVRLLRRPNGGAPAARNTGLRAASGAWTAFTDADCIPSRGWLACLVSAVERAGVARPIGAAGRVVGYGSQSEAARFVDLSGGLDAERHLAHPRFPFAPSSNLMYRRDVLVEAGGFDERYATYDACDLHQRVRRIAGGPFYFEPRAVVLHRHREGWKAYWRQQVAYGRGYAQFMLHHRGEVAWSWRDEMRALSQLMGLGVRACLPGRGSVAICRRGLFVKTLAQHAGFVRAYWNAQERRRW